MWVFTKVVRKRCTTTGYWPKNSHGTGSGNQLNGRLAAKMTVSGTSSGTTDFDTERRRRRVLTADATDPECLDASMPECPTSPHPAGAGVSSSTSRDAPAGSQRHSKPRETESQDLPESQREPSLSQDSQWVASQ